MQRPTALCLAALALAATASADPLADRVTALTKLFKGTVVVYARNLDTGQEFALGADTPVRTASTIKLPILCALEQLVAAGTLRWDRPLTMKAGQQIEGSGVMAQLSPGATLSLRDVATLMIIVSDNTATNLVLDQVTTEAVNTYMDTLGLAGTRSLRKVRGSLPEAPGGDGWSTAGRRPETQRFGLGVSTPRDMVRLLEMLEQGKVVSAEASKDVLGILRRQQYKTGIGRRAGDGVEVASKSGSLDALRSDVGIAYTKGGRIAMAITVDDMPVIDYSPDNAGEELIWEISKALMEGLGRQP